MVNEEINNSIVTQEMNSDKVYNQSNTPQSFLDKIKDQLKLFISVFLIIILLIIGTTGYLYWHLHKTINSTNLAAEPQIAVFNLPGATFAPYEEVKSNVQPNIPSYSLNTSELINLSNVETASKEQFNQNELSALQNPGFFIQPGNPASNNSDPNIPIFGPYPGRRSDDMVDIYGKISGNTSPAYRTPENAVFLTTDFLMHTYHILIDRTFQNIESVKLQPDLKLLTNALYMDALTRYNQESNLQLKESWKRLSVFYLVPLVLLKSNINQPTQYFDTQNAENQNIQKDQNADTPANVQIQLQKFQSSTPSEIYQLASREIDLIMKAQAFNVSSPLYSSLQPNTTVDYTQFQVRGHYTRTSVLRSYFRAMEWYGRQNFNVNNLDLTRDALLMTWQLGSVKVNGATASDIWQKIYLPTVFFVGKSDNLTLYDYAGLMSKIYGKSVSYSELADNKKLQEFRAQAEKLPGPKILSDLITFNSNNTPNKDHLLQSSRGFRFMGQRFIPDSYIFTSLTQGGETPDPETGQKLPSTPTALMVMSILGSKTADNLLNDWVASNAAQSNKVIAKNITKLKNEFAQFDEKTWTQNVYWAWLYNLLPLFDNHPNGYPMFMQGDPWTKKSLVTALGSWTELRHDTLLYSKESFSEMGGGGPQATPPPVPKGYVEPNLSFLTRLIALTTMTEQGLNSNGLLIPGQKEKFDTFLQSLQFFKSIAEKELSNTVISDDDFEELRTIIKLNYPNIVWTPDGKQMTEQDARDGIISDVHTDTVKNQVLYEATGYPSVIYVAIKDINGTRLTRGVTYSYYEFTKPVGSRMTDSDWQSMIYEGKNTNQLPTQPSWTNDLVK